MGNKEMMLPVKAEIRKKIKKEAGDEVHIQLDLEDNSGTLPEEVRTCFELESGRLEAKFKRLTTFEKITALDLIYAAKSEPEKADRIAQLIRKLSE